MTLPDVPAGREPEGPYGAAARVLVSDADRGRFADVIGDAFAEGRLTREEYEDRLTAAMAARTVGDLVPVLEGLPPATQAAALAPLVGLADLPVPAPGQAVASSQWFPPEGTASSSSGVVAIFGGATRKGEWVVPAQMTAFAMFGGVELDLRSATFAGPEAEIVAVAVMGGVDITVPEGLTVQVDGMGIFGGFDQRAEGPGRPGAPVLRIKGVALFGGVDVKRKPRKKGIAGGGAPQQLPPS
ncbi:MAG: DUF1707 domain-containing protein [Candidatus Nanopelagicales bacterium]|nr:DUF1707 domain-containing protein [Candidatus Nanopelagicales bacterium]